MVQCVGKQGSEAVGTGSSPRIYLNFSTSNTLILQFRITRIEFFSSIKIIIFRRFFWCFLEESANFCRYYVLLQYYKCYYYYYYYFIIFVIIFIKFSRIKMNSVIFPLIAFPGIRLKCIQVQSVPSTGK